MQSVREKVLGIICCTTLCCAVLCCLIYNNDSDKLDLANQPINDAKVTKITRILLRSRFKLSTQPVQNSLHYFFQQLLNLASSECRGLIDCFFPAESLDYIKTLYVQSPNNIPAATVKSPRNSKMRIFSFGENVLYRIGRIVTN